MYVLLVDDNEGDRLLAKTYLTGAADDLKIDEASSASSAREQMDNQEYDCLFLDYRLPDMNGLDFLKQIFDEQTGLAPCPVIMLTGIGRESVMFEALEYGAQEYLYKDTLSSEMVSVALRKAQKVYELTKVHSSTQKQLFQAQKMDSIGRLAGGIAHDFNNMLAIIMGNIQLLEHTISPDNPEIEKIQKRIAPIQRTTQASKLLIERLMHFTQQSQDEKKTLNLNVVIEDIISLCTSILNESVHLELSLGDGLWNTEISAAQLEQAILNLVINAKHAMPNGGALRLTTLNVDKDEAVANPALKEEDYVLLRVEDTGEGIPEDLLDKIFDPFFTTKSADQGTGLGLSTVYGFVTAHGGVIKVKNNKSGGACFEIFLPRSLNETTSPQIDRGDISDYMGDGERVLIVEDEADLSQPLLEMLKNNNYVVSHEKSADDALEHIKAHADEIDLIISDTIMSGMMNGGELGLEVLKNWPSIKYILMTGYASKDIPRYDEIQKKFVVLKKPFEVEVLLKKMRAVLDV